MERPATYDYSKLKPIPRCPHCGTHGKWCQYDDDRGVTRCVYTGKTDP